MWLVSMVMVSQRPAHHFVSPPEQQDYFVTTIGDVGFARAHTVVSQDRQIICVCCDPQTEHKCSVNMEQMFRGHGEDDARQFSGIRN